MSKRIISLLLLSMLLLLSGCTEEPASPATIFTVPETLTPGPPPTEAAPPTEELPPPETLPPAATEAPATEVSPEPVPTVETSSTLPYLLRIDRADQSVYSGPGYDYVFSGTVRERGTYTIVEEATDPEGNLWGRLKSGIGWVDLTQIRSEEYAESLISANYADEYLLLHGAYHYCPYDQSEYAISIAFRAYGNLRDVALFAYDFSDAGLVPGADFFTLAEWTPDMPLVAELSFPGDMTTYGIRFADENGVTHIYSIYISLRNGALMLTKE